MAVEHAQPLHVPAGVVAQVWRDAARQVRLTRLVNSARLDVRSLDLDEAKIVGALCGAAGTSDVVDASVALLAHRYDATVVTSDPGDIGRLDPTLRVFTC